MALGWARPLTADQTMERKVGGQEVRSGDLDIEQAPDWQGVGVRSWQREMEAHLRARASISGEERRAF